MGFNAGDVCSHMSEQYPRHYWVLCRSRSAAYENKALDINKHRSSVFVIGSSQSISSSKDKIERCTQRGCKELELGFPFIGLLFALVRSNFACKYK